MSKKIFSRPKNIASHPAQAAPTLLSAEQNAILNQAIAQYDQQIAAIEQQRQAVDNARLVVVLRIFSELGVDYRKYNFGRCAADPQAWQAVAITLPEQIETK